MNAQRLTSSDLDNCSLSELKILFRRMPGYAFNGEKIELFIEGDGKMQINCIDEEINEETNAIHKIDRSQLEALLMLILRCDFFHLQEIYNTFEEVSIHQDIIQLEQFEVTDLPEYDLMVTIRQQAKLVHWIEGTTGLLDKLTIFFHGLRIHPSVYVKSKPKECPYCLCKEIANILYDTPNAETMALAESGKVIFKEERKEIEKHADWGCPECHSLFFKEIDE